MTIENENKVIFTNVYESDLYAKDNDFLREVLEEKWMSYEDARDILARIDELNNKKFYTKDITKEEDGELDLLNDKIANMLTEVDWERIDEEKENYYSWDFWTDTEYFQDNINLIRWNFYYDKDNQEIIINNWFQLERDENWRLDIDNEEIYTIENDEFINNRKMYEKVFKAFMFWDFSDVIETDYIDIEWDWSWASRYTNMDKPNFLIKYRWWQGYTYRIYEYDLK